jgi:hypothetical protein
MWDSELLASFEVGYIIVMAENIEEARLKALNTFSTSMLYENDSDKKAFEADIAHEPSIIDTGVKFIHGSY